ncbi:MAG: restriction endonuclease [Chlorobi bacterium]|nr:restriction endonuclease [Chlorobiota bacterium]
MSTSDTSRKFTFKGIPCRTTLDLDEITSGTQFEELVVAYFKLLSEDRSNNVTEVIAGSTKIGPDGGVDVLVIFTMTDSLSQFKRTWVVQCKFHTKAIGQSQLSKINLPTLVQQYNAVGYLLICKTNPTTQVATQFKELSNPQTQYLIWTGEEFKARLIEQPDIHKQFFPEYHAYTELLHNIKRGQP